MTVRIGIRRQVKCCKILAAVWHMNCACHSRCTCPCWDCECRLCLHHRDQEARTAHRLTREDAQRGQVQVGARKTHGARRNHRGSVRLQDREIAGRARVRGGSVGDRVRGRGDRARRGDRCRECGRGEAQGGQQGSRDRAVQGRLSACVDVQETGVRQGSECVDSRDDRSVVWKRVVTQSNQLLTASNGLPSSRYPYRHSGARWRDCNYCTATLGRLLSDGHDQH